MPKVSPNLYYSTTSNSPKKKEKQEGFTSKPVTDPLDLYDEVERIEVMEAIRKETAMYTIMSLAIMGMGVAGVSILFYVYNIQPTRDWEKENGDFAAVKGGL
ncbi:hypothetical protein HK098_003121 [Nowakowskiella sp. JEL0407]|nr:hypothetical protein HK098_003121 [Nowakowskiella sp. JEL0407]